MNVTCSNQWKAVLHFAKRGFFEKQPKFDVNGEVCDPEGNFVGTLQGRWDTHLNYIKDGVETEL